MGPAEYLVPSRKAAAAIETNTPLLAGAGVCFITNIQESKV
jgi:hypothetical protein